MNDSEKKEHRLVLSDESEEQVGIVVIDRSKTFDNKGYHWIHMPNGQVRKWYRFKNIDASDFDMLLTFKSLPKLKVSYRNISGKISSYDSEFFYELLTIFAIPALLWGIVIMFTGIGWQNADALINHWVGIFITILTGGGFCFLLTVCIITEVCSNRYRGLTKHDHELLKKKGA